MSEKIPTGLEAIAVAANVLDPQDQWTRFVKRNGGAAPTSQLEYRWSLWILTAPKRPAQGEPATLPGVESRTKRRARELHESIREAQRLDPKKEIGIAACAKILEELDKIGKDPEPARRDRVEEETQGDPFAGLLLP